MGGFFILQKQEKSVFSYEIVNYDKNMFENSRS